jgi:2-C-methyl-D-erythritol 4-phosphate cytidylyltransferase
MSTIFSVAVLTAPPPGLGTEGGGAMTKLDGREALLRSVELFLNRENIKQIQLVVADDAAEEVKRKFGGNLGFMGVKLVTTGKKWTEQLTAAAAKLISEATHLVVHDASRPLVPYSDLEALLADAEKHPAVILATPVRSAMLEVDEGNHPVAQHGPGGYFHLLSPMAINRSRLAELTSGREIHPSEWTIVRASALNIRLSGAGDASMAKAMLNLMPKPKIKALSNPFEEAQW